MSDDHHLARFSLMGYRSKPMDSTCPRCRRDSMSDGVCMFCGPDVAAPPAVKDEPAPALHPGWKGFDRDLGAKKRREREAQHSREDEEARARRRLWGSLGTVFSLAVVVAVGWLMYSGALERTPVEAGTGGAPAIPVRLVKPPSPARADIGLLARELQEVSSEAGRRLNGQLDGDALTAGRLLTRLHQAHETARLLEPKASREEGRVLMALENARRLIEAHVQTFRTDAPDLTEARLTAANEQVERALVVLRGGRLDDLVVTYAKKASAANEAAKQLENP